MQRLVRQKKLLPLMIHPFVAYLVESRRAGTLFDEKEMPSLSDKLFPRVLHDLSYILRIPQVAAALVRKPLSAASSDPGPFAKRARLEGDRDGQAAASEGGGIDMMETEVGGEGAGMLDAGSDLAQAVIQAVLGGPAPGPVRVGRGTPWGWGWMGVGRRTT